MKIVPLGDTALAADLLQLCLRAGHSAAPHSDSAPVDKTIDVAIECCDASKAAKRRAVEALSGAQRLYVSALACSATEAASWAARPAAVVGWGALPPLPNDGTIEIAPALQSTPEALSLAQRFWASLGLKTTLVADGPGLVRARVVCALVNEAATALAEGVAAPADIDTAMKLGTNYPRGPLEWGDLIGLDVVLGVMRSLQEEFGEDRYRPAPLLTRYVQAGRLGKKSGQGFFQYP